MSVRQNGVVIAGGGTKDMLTQKNITNCITEIPQDIKLELSSGTLTLKAGSKVYVPNGSGVFDEITIASDLTINGFGTGTRQMIVCYRNTQLDADPYSFSGTSTPSGSGFFYNTSTNKIDYVSSGTALGRTYSFPLCIVTFVDSAISSIDQVFNGFGYIGSTVFALPGVKGLIPNGRNADGSLKNTTTNDFTTVKTVQVNTSTAKIAMYSGGDLGSQTKNFGLNEPENYNYDSGILTNALEVASVIVNSSAKITSFEPKTVFHAVDYSEFDRHKLINYQAPTSANNYTWYKKYKDGWVEQGGSSFNGTTKTLPVVMADTNYTVTTSFAANTSANTMQWQYVGVTKSTTSISRSANSIDMSWYVAGMAA